MNATNYEKVLRYIIQHEEEWNQHEWVCRTGGCVAGNAARLARQEASGAEKPEPWIDLWYAENESYIDVGGIAEDWLELDARQRTWLFTATNSLDDLILFHLFDGDTDAVDDVCGHAFLSSTRRDAIDSQPALREDIERVKREFAA